MTYRLMLLDHVKYDVPHYRVIEKNFETVTKALGAKRSYQNARPTCVEDAANLAESMDLRTPWKVEEDK